jgi:hypothetical protein
MDVDVSDRIDLIRPSYMDPGFHLMAMSVTSTKK